MAADPGLAGTSTSRCRNAEHERVAARRLERLAHVINPGGWAVESARPIATLLGSCVAVCLYDTRLRLAGMNHFLLPGGTRRHVDGDEIVLQGDYAMEVLRNAMFARGAHPSRLVAKAFGGGNVVSGIHTAIGTRNAEFARNGCSVSTFRYWQAIWVAPAFARSYSTRARATSSAAAARFVRPRRSP